AAPKNLSAKPSRFRPSPMTRSTFTSCAVRLTSAKRNTTKPRQNSKGRGVQLERSVNSIKQAVSLEPTNGAYLDSLGSAYFKLGKYDLAEETLTKASLRMG